LWHLWIYTKMGITQSFFLRLYPKDRPKSWNAKVNGGTPTNTDFRRKKYFAAPPTCGRNDFWQNNFFSKKIYQKKILKKFFLKNIFFISIYVFQQKTFFSIIILFEFFSSNFNCIFSNKYLFLKKKSKRFLIFSLVICSSKEPRAF